MTFFASKILCFPFIVAINGETEIHVPMDKRYHEPFEEVYYYGIINFATRGTQKIKSVPPIYLNNKYFGEDCGVEGDGYSIKCTIKDEKWYHMDAEKPVKYKVNELYQGCYGPIFTGITIYVSGEALYNNLFMLLFIILILF